MPMANTVQPSDQTRLQVNIPTTIKKQAEKSVGKYGLSLGSAIKIFMASLASDKISFGIMQNQNQDEKNILIDHFP